MKMEPNYPKIYEKWNFGTHFSLCLYGKKLPDSRSLSVRTIGLNLTTLELASFIFLID